MSNLEFPPAAADNNKTKLKAPKEPKESKIKAPKEPKESKIKAQKEPKESKIKAPKESKESKIKAPKEPKELKIKAPKEPKELKIKAPKEPKVKGIKVKSNPSTDTAGTDISVSLTECAPNILKKRGRKPKGGKIISSFTTPFINTSDDSGTNGDDTAYSNNNKHMNYKQPFVSSNIILHLKCNYNDLLVNNSMSSFTYEPVVEDVESYINCGDLSETAGMFTEIVPGMYAADDVNSIINNDGADIIGIGINNECDVYTHTNKHAISTASSCLFQSSIAMASASVQPITTTMCVPIKSPYVIASAITQSSNDINMNNAQTAQTHNAAIDADVEMKEVWKKINRLKLVLHKDNARFNSTQQSGCFWCTCEFDTPVIHIPKLYTKSTDSYTVYGCFCSPECATSYLMKETIDTSTRFERYQMLNVMYNNICNNTDKPIKPAPDPHYLLSKFYGNLSIDEYRKLLKSDHLLYIVNKPLTHSLPELYEDNNEFLVNNKTTIPNAMSKTKKR